MRQIKHFVFLTLINYDLFVLSELSLSTVEELCGVCSCNLMKVPHKFPSLEMCISCATLFIFHFFPLNSGH